ncbi:MAG: short chain dehydrogenase [Armatimonadota bacterium]
MKIIVVGATGTIGEAVADALQVRHEVLRVSRTGGDYRADISDKDSLSRMFAAAAPFDAVVSAAGSARFAPFLDLTDEDFAFSMANKLMGQANLVRVGLQFISDDGSFTLTSGVLGSQPMCGSAAISLVNAGLEGFVRAAALELVPRGIRVNVVSPPWVSETLSAMGRDVADGMPAADVARAYVHSVEDSNRSGEVLRAEDF